MARPLRIEYAHATYHVSNRGFDRKRLFADTHSRQLFLQGVEEACQRFNVRVHTWCLLSNEYHLLITTAEANLSRFMRQLDGVFTQNIQKLRNSRGSVFRTRYKAVLVQAPRYLLPVSVFLHGKAAGLNGEFTSSLEYFTSAGKPPAWMDRDCVLDKLEVTSRRAAAYRALMDAPADPELQRFYARKNLLSVLGDENFKASARRKVENGSGRADGKVRVSRSRPSISVVVKAVALQFKVDEQSIFKAARGPGSRNLPRWVAMYLCQEVAGVTLQSVANRFDLKRYGTVSTTIGKLKHEMEQNPRTQTVVRKLQKQLAQG